MEGIESFVGMGDEPGMFRRRATAATPSEVSEMRRKFQRSFEEAKLDPHSITPEQYRAFSNTKFQRNIRNFTRISLVVLPLFVLYSVTEENFSHKGHTILHTVSLRFPLITPH